MFCLIKLERFILFENVVDVKMIIGDTTETSLDAAYVYGNQQSHKINMIIHVKHLNIISVRNI